MCLVISGHIGGGFQTVFDPDFCQVRLILVSVYFKVFHVSPQNWSPKFSPPWRAAFFAPIHFIDTYFYWFWGLARRRRKILWFYARKWRFYPSESESWEFKNRKFSFHCEFCGDTYPHKFSRIPIKWILWGYVSPKTNTADNQ